MARKTRMVEMYIGEGGDFGTWGTEYVDIPIDTPDDKIDEVAIETAKAIFKGYAFLGVYSVVPLDELEYFD